MDKTAPPAHVVWDWNGTLVADTAATVAAANAALAAIGRPGDVALARWRDLSTRPIIKTYRQLAGGGLTDAEWETIKAVWAQAYEAEGDRIALTPGALDALRAVRERGAGQSVVSLHLAEPLLAQMEKLGVRGFFQGVSAAPAESGSGGLGTKAELLARHLAELGLAPERTLVVGDMADDAAAAAAVHARAVLVTVGDTSRARLEATGWPLADSLVEAVGCLRECA
ncbi:MAG: HAD hydrolase-like protein [Bifidobacteriaceae bacterium]|jgi:phosphoglycolate phosphatase-like HAD superfamily hydrolase|nr:HAD hydrolase-like protein [Bifidobacteriaceae bacterium]